MKGKDKFNRGRENFTTIFNRKTSSKVSLFVNERHNMWIRIVSQSRSEVISFMNSTKRGNFTGPSGLSFVLPLLELVSAERLLLPIRKLWESVICSSEREKGMVDNIPRRDTLFECQYKDNSQKSSRSTSKTSLTESKRASFWILLRWSDRQRADHCRAIYRI